jgi:hypothetical protein
MRRILDWVPQWPDDVDDVVIWVDVEKVDAAWQGTTLYIPPGAPGGHRRK